MEKVSVSVLKKNGIEKSIGIGFKKVSVSVSKHLVTKTVSVSVSRKIGIDKYRNRFGKQFGIKNIGI